MSYTKPAELVERMIDAGEYKLKLSTRDTLIRAYMGAALLTLGAAFAVTVGVQTGQPLLGAVLFPVGFVLLYLLGYDLLTGVFTLGPMALYAKRPGLRLRNLFRNWGLVFLGNFLGAFTVAVLMAIYFTYGFSAEASPVGQAIGEIGHGRTVGYAEHGAAGMLTLVVRGILCNWMVSTGIVAFMMSDTLVGKVVGMWLPIMLFFYMGFEHSIVNMFLFPSGLLLGADFTISDYLLWNELPTIVGNLIGGLTFVAIPLYATHRKRADKTLSLPGDTPRTQRARRPVTSAKPVPVVASVAAD